MLTPSMGIWLFELNFYLFGEFAYYFPFALFVLNYLYYKRGYELQNFTRREFFGLAFAFLACVLLFASFYADGFILQLFYVAFSTFFGYLGSGIIGLLFLLFSIVLLFPNFIKEVFKFELNFTKLERLEGKVKSALMQIFGGEKDGLDDLENSEPKAPAFTPKISPKISQEKDASQEQILEEQNLRQEEIQDFQKELKMLNIKASEGSNKNLTLLKNEILSLKKSLNSSEISQEEKDFEDKQGESFMNENSTELKNFVQKASRARISLDEEFDFIYDKEVDMIPERFLKPKKKEDFKDLQTKENLELPSYQRKNISIQTPSNEQKPKFFSKELELREELLQKAKLEQEFKEYEKQKELKEQKEFQGQSPIISSSKYNIIENAQNSANSANSANFQNSANLANSTNSINSANIANSANSAVEGAKTSENLTLNAQENEQKNTTENKQENAPEILEFKENFKPKSESEKNAFDFVPVVEELKTPLAPQVHIVNINEVEDKNSTNLQNDLAKNLTQETNFSEIKQEKPSLNSQENLRRNAENSQESLSKNLANSQNFSQNFQENKNKLKQGNLTQENSLENLRHNATNSANFQENLNLNFTQKEREILRPKFAKNQEIALNQSLLREIEQGELEAPRDFTLPSLEFLSTANSQKQEFNESEIDKKIYDLLEKLRRFKIGGDVINTYTGPVVTTFEFRPSADVKVSRILNLQDDLAMALRAKSIRIQAPIPGKDVVGIEVPNEKIETIYLREILESEVFKNAKSSLTIALGKDIVGNAFVTDLKKLPHLLIAGTTGSGKSVGINSMLLSLLYRNSPKTLRLMMIDPKMLEFSIYNDIPHLLTPVITDPKKAINALSNMVAEMERRYRLMAEAKTKNIENYNEKIKELGGEEFPFIVVIIDELADLMMNGGKDVEFYIARLAQMARASGIHLIVATQRPSVDVVTGLIKANLPSRISYKVGQKIDSKVILDTVGAESLLGRGDCLFTPPGTSNIIRLHAPFASEFEIEKVVEFLKAQQSVVYDESFLRDEQGVSVGVSDFESTELDELYEEAKRVILEDQKTSISYLQRRLKIGYNRAANIIEQLSENGILSKPDSKGQREILV